MDAYVIEVLSKALNTINYDIDAAISRKKHYAVMIQEADEMLHGLYDKKAQLEAKLKRKI